MQLAVPLKPSLGTPWRLVTPAVPKPDSRAASPSFLAVGVGGFAAVGRRRVGRLADEHEKAVRTWVERVIMGYNFCPYAKPSAQHLRIVTSSAQEAADVLEDLSTEALRLSPTPLKDLEIGEAATTLLVCPFVQQWESFDAFQHFFQTQLSNGYHFAKQDLYIVAFHPNYGRMLELGESVEVAGQVATVLNTNAGFSARGQILAKVGLASGEETFIELPPTDPGECLVSTAPRPVLHLLRTRDLEEANDTDIRRRNGATIKDIGEDAIRKAIRLCG
ncbi:unnamed protein product [Effrenium voratum]|nr:unnamed protein product [Effrenium voratum]